MPDSIQDEVSAAERSRILIESIKDYAILWLDTGGRVTSWNPGVQAIKGYRADEIIGQHFSVFYPEEARALCDNELQVAQTTGRFQEEGWRVRKDGSRFWASVVLTPARNEAGQLLGFAKITRDLTERRNAGGARTRRYDSLRIEPGIRNKFLCEHSSAHEGQLGEQDGGPRHEQAWGG